eukprot:6459435-Amphidinium_carterae.1
MAVVLAALHTASHAAQLFSNGNASKHVCCYGTIPHWTCRHGLSLRKLPWTMRQRGNLCQSVLVVQVGWFAMMLQCAVDLGMMPQSLTCNLGGGPLQSRCFASSGRLSLSTERRTLDTCFIPRPFHPKQNR